MKHLNRRVLMVLVYLLLGLPGNLYALQFHSSSEGIITHQIGHLFFLFSMVVLIFIISGKGLTIHKGWRLIQFSAFFFILWNGCALAAHFLDNQIYAVSIEQLANGYARIQTQNNSSLLGWLYYGLKLDHLLCVPAMFLMYKGLSCLVDEQKAGQGQNP
ncbi:hypothetical protein DO021_06925 [Desulfobacter hydrogenophilus]|uniref:DUF4149 domain-containing protein n=1 Tax=Desulfobacter hydrogenophilus TaxID=2291 RepID=A0A328FDI2_9BACT|nr:hypothetical protein [Desulfobacter hydrogenophilus]NDY71276.1 hypothetical protein [Desulfobacter hydrogenophilus]QBH14989.1 hypothetical protein EYB58_19935 [Desulfobacter hydrogenophilus]RAM02764.1 hypothetical protein DO021_06925 [Desulfobacter hydrogenophilus]